MILTIALSACGFSSRSPILPPSISVEQKAEIDTLVEETVQQGPLASIAIGILVDGEPPLAQGYGVSSTATNESAGPHVIYQIGSITKTFTAVSIMVLVQEGKISLDEPISNYVKELPAEAEAILIGDLMAHTSGLPNLEETTIDIDYSRSYMPADVVELLSGQFPDLRFEPGSAFHYSNLGYFLLGVLIEEVTGQDYYSFVRSKLLDPWDLADTGKCEAIQGRKAEGYKVLRNKLVPAEAGNLSLAYSAGGLCSSVIDLVNWYAHLSTGKVIDRDLYEQVIRPVVLPDGAILESGLGFIVGDFLGAQAIGHIGRTSGFESFIVDFYEDDLTIVVVSNTNRSDPYAISDLIS